MNPFYFLITQIHTLPISEEFKQIVLKLIRNRGFSGKRETGLSSKFKTQRAEVIFESQLSSHQKLTGDIDHLKTEFLEKVDFSHKESFKNGKDLGKTNHEMANPKFRMSVNHIKDT